MSFSMFRRLEAIENVNISTNAFDADQSAGGGYINVTVKTGTNALHGSGFFDYSDQSLAAYQWIADRTKAKLPYRNNQFGGTIGGPIKRDKLFYFFSYEGTRLLQGNAISTEVPTAAMKMGNLRLHPLPSMTLNGRGERQRQEAISWKYHSGIPHRSRGAGANQIQTLGRIRISRAPAP